jgi:hypothetical protein
LEGEVVELENRMGIDALHVLDSRQSKTCNASIRCSLPSEKIKIKQNKRKSTMGYPETTQKEVGAILNHQP